MCPPSRCLADILASIEEHDGSPETQYQLVMHAVCKALDVGLEAGCRVHPDVPEWMVAYIELPTGQVAWHVPQHPRCYDAHTQKQRHERIHAFQRQVAGDQPAT